MTSTDEEMTMKPSGRRTFDDCVSTVSSGACNSSNSSCNSSNSSAMSETWTCVVCKYRNCDMKFERCAMCGSKEANFTNLEERRFRIQIKQQRRYGGGIGIMMHNRRRLVAATTTPQKTKAANQEAASSTGKSVTSSTTSSSVDVKEQSKTPRPPSSCLPDFPRSPPSYKLSRKTVLKSNSHNEAEEEVDDDTLVQSGLNNTTGNLNEIFRPQTTHPKDSNWSANNNGDQRKYIISHGKPASRPMPLMSSLTCTSMISTQQVDPPLGIRKPRHDSFDDEVIPPDPNNRPPKSPTGRRRYEQKKHTTTTINNLASSNDINDDYNDGSNNEKVISSHSSPPRCHLNLMLDTYTSTAKIKSTSETTESSIRGLSSTTTGSDDESSSANSSTEAARDRTVNNLATGTKDTKRQDTNKDKQEEGHRKSFDGSALSWSSIDAIDHRMFGRSDNNEDTFSVSERSYSGFSISSHSTVKQSNTTISSSSTGQNQPNISIGENKRMILFQNRRIQAGISHSQNDENRSLHLEQNTGVPMITQSFSSDDGEDLRASLAMEPRQFSSVANWTIQEDREVVPPTLPSFFPSSISTQSLRLSSTDREINADTPSQIDQTRSRHLHGHGEDGLQSILSSYRSGVSSGVLSDAAVYDGEDYSSNRNSTAVNDTTNDPPSRDPPEDDRSHCDSDAGIDVEQSKKSPVQKEAQKTRNVGPCLFRSVVVSAIVLSATIVLVVLALGGNKETVSQLSDHTTDPPSSNDTETIEDGSVVAPPSESEGEVEAKARLIAEMKGEPFDMIGRKVAVGGPTGSILVGMIHDGFVRFERLGLDGESVWTTVGSDIPVKDGTQIAISSRASRFAVVENSVVTVRQLTSIGQDDEIGQWETLDVIDVGNHDDQIMEGAVLSSSLSFSSSGKYLAHATIFASPRTRGYVLSIARETVRTENTEEEGNDSAVAMSEILDFDDHSDFVRVSISDTGDRLSACTRNKIIVLETREGKFSDLGIQPILPFGSIINDCDFASDGLTIAASLSDAAATILFSLRNGVWEQMDDAIPFSGNSIVLSSDSGVAVVADSSLEYGMVTVWTKQLKGKSEDGYRLVDALLGTSGRSDFGVSLALCQRRDFDGTNYDVLVVGAPGGVQKEGAVRVYRL